MLKCTAFFTIGIQGWTETWFRDGTNPDSAMVPLQNLVTARLRMCPATVAVTALRVSVVENPAVFVIRRPSSSLGTYATTRDVTNLAIFWQAVTSTFGRRQVVTRGTPDDCVSSGVYVATAGFATAAQDWATAVGINSFAIRLTDRTQPLFDVQTIDATGAMITYLDPGWDRGDKLKFFRGKTTDGKPIKSTIKIATRTDGTHYQLVAWPAGRAAFNVRARKLLYVLQIPTTIVNAVAGTRKTGRPFGMRAGRRKTTAA